MKIAHLVTVFPPYKSGIGNAAFVEASGLAKLGHEVTVFTPAYENNRLEIKDLRFKVEYIKSILKYGNAAWVPKITKELNNFDLVCLHYPFIGGAEAFIFSKINKPMIIRYHMDLGLPKPYYFLTNTYNSLITKNIFKKANRVLVSSFDYAENSKLIKKFFKKNKEKFIELPYGVDIDKFKPVEKNNELLKKLSLTEKDKIILFVGGLDKAHYFKGINLLIKAVNKLKKLTISYKLIIVGKGSEKTKYEKTAKELKVNDRVIFVNNVENQELPDYYNLADVFVLPSINNLESFGIVLIEAMACGKPCIASSLPGVRTVVDDNQTGFLVEPNNIDDLTEKIKKIIGSSELAKKMGEASREKVIKNYNQVEIIKKLEEIYASLVKK